MSECMPCLIKALGESVALTPLAWWEYPDRVVITFVEGPKLTFMRGVEEEPQKAETSTQPKKKRRTKK